MPKSKPPYPLEFRRQMVALVRAGRSPRELSAEFGPSINSIREWAKQSDRDEGLRADGLTTLEREELRLEREILSKAAAWFARETGSIPSGDSSS